MNNCKLCEGTGYIKDIQYDTDANCYYDGGSIKCKHTYG